MTFPFANVEITGTEGRIIGVTFAEVLRFSETEMFEGRLGRENLVELARLASGYTQGFEAERKAAFHRQEVALEQHRRLLQLREDFRSLYHKLDRWTKTHNRLAKELPQIWDDMRIPISVAHTEKVIADLKPEEGENAEEKLARALLGLAAGVLDGGYDIGKMLMNTLPPDTSGAVDSILDELVQFKDAGDMYNRSVQNGVIFQGYRIPDDLTPEFAAGVLESAKGDCSIDMSKIRLLLPPLSSPQSANLLNEFAHVAHEIRHNGRHFGDLAVSQKIPDLHSTQFEKILEKLMWDKAIEAEGYTFHSFNLYLRLTNGGKNKPDVEKFNLLDDERKADMQCFIEAMHECDKAAPMHEKYMHALAETFIHHLEGLRQYEKSYSMYMGFSYFPEEWEKTIQTLDMEWMENLTRMKSLGNKPYIKNTPEMRERILEALRKTGQSRRPAQVVQPSVSEAATADA